MSALNASNKSEIITGYFCVDITNKRIANTRIKYFDLFLLLPSLSFFIFLLFHCRNMVKRVFSNSSSIITTFYVLLFLGCSLKVVRALVVMILNSEDGWLHIVDKVLWLIVRFFLLATEMSIITFGVAAARLDSRAGIRRVLAVTTCISLTYTLIQASLEFGFPDMRFRTKNFSIYGHGGAIFFFASSLFLLMVYCSVLLLPITKCSNLMRLPTKRMFYVYCSILAVLYAAEAVGSMLFYFGFDTGLCMISIGSLLYFVCYDPLVFATFLHNYFRTRKALAFKYAQHVVEYPDTSEECHKGCGRHRLGYSLSSGAGAASCEKTAGAGAGEDEQEEAEAERGAHFYPDRLVTVERGQGDVFTIRDILKRFNILSAGARLDYASRHPSSVSAEPGEGGQRSSRDEIDDSIVLSLSDDDDREGGAPERKLGCVGQTWDMKNFASQRQ